VLPKIKGGPAPKKGGRGNKKSGLEINPFLIKHQ